MHTCLVLMCIYSNNNIHILTHSQSP